MIERAIEIKSLLSHMVLNLPSLTNNWPTDNEWIILAELLDLLAPFAFMTKIISSSSYPTIGEVKWLFLGIKYHLERNRQENYPLLSHVNEMKRVFYHYFEQIDPLLHIPAFFDPRYKKNAYGNMSQEDILRPVKVAMDNYDESSTPITSEDRTIEELRFQLNNMSTSETRNYFQSFFMPTQNQQQSVSTNNNELNSYFNSNSPDNGVMPNEWWKIHETEYPKLSKMAQDYLSIMSTSVPCEQFFSIAGKQVTQTRNRLHPNTIRACLCLKSWLEQEII